MLIVLVNFPSFPPIPSGMLLQMLELAVAEIQHQDELVWNMKQDEHIESVSLDRLSPSVLHSRPHLTMGLGLWGIRSGETSYLHINCIIQSTSTLYTPHNHSHFFVKQST